MLIFPHKWPQKQNTLIFASTTHIWSDLFFALFVPLLVLIKTDLNLSFTQIGLLKSMYGGSSAILQMPSGLLAEKVGEFWLLIGGNLWVAIGLIIMSLTQNYLTLLITTVIGGLGGGTQHPLATSMVSRFYNDQSRSTSVGTVNFAGDLGKLAAPAITLLISSQNGWRTTLRLVGIAGVAFMVLLTFTKKTIEATGLVQSNSHSDSSSDTEWITGFFTLSLIGFLDSSTRGAALTFVPFTLGHKGMTHPQIFGMLILLLAGGAFGKFVCGWLNSRYDTVSLIWATKSLTALMLAILTVSPSIITVPLMVILGIGLNGTSSVLYAATAELVPHNRRARFYGFLYTTNEIGTTLAPLLYGILADILKLRTTMLIMALITTLIIPISLRLKPYVSPSLKS